MNKLPLLRVECLEERYTPAHFGVPWPDAVHLTLSFAPDGTQVADRSNELFRTLGAHLPTKVWQREILRAFQTWAVNANINVGVVADGGQPFGSAGPLQKDARFGDVRIAAVPMPRDVVAVATPFDVTAGTWSGDVRLNSSYVFGLGGAGNYDLFTVALHEAGHVFGLGHSHDPASAMYESFHHARRGLAPGDVAALHDLYGVRKLDVYDVASTSGNGTFATAAKIAVGKTVAADITTRDDVDVYQFDSSSDGSGFTVRVQTSGLSLLVPRLTVYDVNQNVIDSVVATNPGSGELAINVPSVSPGSTYYAKVEGGVHDVFGIGSYSLGVEPASASTSPTTPGDAPATNDTFTTAASFPEETDRSDGFRDYAAWGTITSSSSQDFYDFRAPKLAGGETTVMTVMAWGLEPGGLNPRVTVYDQNEHPVTAEVLVNDAGTYVIQIPNALSDTLYYAELRSSQPLPRPDAGNYFLAVDFGPTPIALDALAQGNLGDSSRDDSQTFHISQSQLFHFVLSADALNGSLPVAVQMTAQNQKGDILSSLVIEDGEPVSRNLFLEPGAYTFHFIGGTIGQPFAPLSYRLWGLSLSDPIGPEVEDTTFAPAGFSAALRQQSPSHDLRSAVNHPFLTVQDPYSDPHFHTEFFPANRNLSAPTLLASPPPLKSSSPALSVTNTPAVVLPAVGTASTASPASAAVGTTSVPSPVSRTLVSPSAAYNEGSPPRTGASPIAPGSPAGLPGIGNVWSDTVPALVWGRVAGMSNAGSLKILAQTVSLPISGLPSVALGISESLPGTRSIPSALPPVLVRVAGVNNDGPVNAFAQSPSFSLRALDSAQPQKRIVAAPGGFLACEQWSGQALDIFFAHEDWNRESRQSPPPLDTAMPEEAPGSEDDYPVACADFPAKTGGTARMYLLGFLSAIATLALCKQTAMVPAPRIRCHMEKGTKGV